MKYMISFWHVDGGWDQLTQEQKAGHNSALEQFVKDLGAEKQSRLVFLKGPAEAKTVRLQPDGTYQVADGPVVKSKEFAGGYYIIEADSMDEAVEWARKGRFLVGANEVREIFELPM